MFDIKETGGKVPPEQGLDLEYVGSDKGCYFLTDLLEVPDCLEPLDLLTFLVDFDPVPGTGVPRLPVLFPI